MKRLFFRDFPQLRVYFYNGLYQTEVNASWETSKKRNHFKILADKLIKPYTGRRVFPQRIERHRFRSYTRNSPGVRDLFVPRPVGFFAVTFQCLSSVDLRIIHLTTVENTRRLYFWF